MSLKRRDLVNYFVSAAVDIRDREAEVVRIHSKTLKGEPLDDEDVGALVSQQLHAMRHMSNALIMLSRYYEQDNERLRPMIRRALKAALRRLA